MGWKFPRFKYISVLIALTISVVNILNTYLQSHGNNRVLDELYSSPVTHYRECHAPHPTQPYPLPSPQPKLSLLLNIDINFDILKLYWKKCTENSIPLWVYNLSM